MMIPVITSGEDFFTDDTRSKNDEKPSRLTFLGTINTDFGKDLKDMMSLPTKIGTESDMN